MGRTGAMFAFERFRRQAQDRLGEKRGEVARAVLVYQIESVVELGLPIDAGKAGARSRAGCNFRSLSGRAPFATGRKPPLSQRHRSDRQLHSLRHALCPHAQRQGPGRRGRAHGKLT
jgi:hypothetical protein